MGNERKGIKKGLLAAGRRTEFLRERITKWLPFSIVIGLITGLAVAAIDTIIYRGLWHETIQLSYSYGWIAILPGVGIVAATFLVHRFAERPDVHGTDEVIKSFHENAGYIPTRSAIIKTFAAIVTVGLGGSAGLEGPGINAGAAAGSWLHSALRRFKLTDDDRRWMMLAGAAAGMTAVFKAPLTGIVFALEVPYRDDLSHRAVIPALLASATSYVVAVLLTGSEPLFVVPQMFSVDILSPLRALALGIIAGLGARAFVIVFHWSRRTLVRLFPSYLSRAVFSGVVLSISGMVALAFLDAPLSLGTGYEAIRLILSYKLPIIALLVLVTLKVIATSVTLNGGGVGGSFIPLIFMGAAVGSVFGQLIGSTNIVYPIMGMAGFVSAGFNTPLAAAAFVAETTGSPAFIIPGLLASAVSYLFSGRIGLPKFQRFGKEVVVSRIKNLRVSSIMKTPVISVRDTEPVSRFLETYVLKYRHLNFPVLDKEGLLAGMVGVSELKDTPEEEWAQRRVGDIMATEIKTVTPEETVGVALNIMEDSGLAELPVVEKTGSRSIVGIISLSDLIRAEHLADLLKTKGK